MLISRTFFLCFLFFEHLSFGSSRLLLKVPVPPAAQINLEDFEENDLVYCQNNPEQTDSTPGNKSIEFSLKELPGDNCGNQILKILNDYVLKSSSEEPIRIDIAMYSFDDDFLTDKLIEILRQKKESLKIRILTDKSQLFDKKLGAGRQAQLNKFREFFAEPNSPIEIKYIGGYKKPGNNWEYYRIMHLKMLSVTIGNRIFIVEMGSFNWTTAARTKNYENCMIVKSRRISTNPPRYSSLHKTVESIIGSFEILWSLPNATSYKDPQAAGSSTSTSARSYASVAASSSKPKIPPNSTPTTPSKTSPAPRKAESPPSNSSGKKRK